MERRTALALAAAAAGTVLAASAAFAANVGFLEPSDTAPVGILDASVEDPTTAPLEPTVVTVVVEDPPIPTASVPVGELSQAPAPVIVGDSSSRIEPGADDEYGSEADDEYESYEDDEYESYEDDDD